MTRTASAEQSLINDTEFLDELEGSDHVALQRPDRLFDPRPLYDAPSMRSKAGCR